MADLDARAADAIAKGTIEAFLDAEVARDRDALEGWLNGDDLPIQVFLAIAEACAASGRVALLRPSRQLACEAYHALRAAEKKASGGRPSGKTFSIGAFEQGRDIPLDVAYDAMRYLIGATDPLAFRDASHAHLFREEVEAACRFPALDDLVAEKLARAPGALADPYDPGRLVRLYGGRIVAIHLRALRAATPDAADALRLGLEALTAVEDASRGAAFDAAVEAWHAENGPFLVVDEDQLPPRPFGRGWLKPDLFAKLTGRSAPRPEDGDPRRKAFEALPDDRRRELASESFERRSKDFAAWVAWLDAELAKLKTP